MIKLSVIVPVYNVEEYLSRCIDSIISQNLNDYEIILVDDESTDNSGEIAERYSKKYEFVRVIHQKNKGLSGARNTGLCAANGEYILFVDSDDWLVPNSIGKILQEAQKRRLDVGVADFQYVNCRNEEKVNTIKPYHVEKPIDGREFFLQSLKHKCALNCVWKSIYQKEFLIENKLFFREGFNHEDEEWTPRVYFAASYVKDIPVVFYNYYQREDSITNRAQTFTKNSLDLISNCYELKKLSFALVDGELKCLFQDRIVGLFLSAFFKGRLLSSQYKNVINKNFFDQMYLGKSNSKKVALFKFNRYVYYYCNKFIKSFRR